MNSGGDVLARGGVRAQFGTADVSEERWKEIFGEEGLRKMNAMDEKEREEVKTQALPLIRPQDIKLDYEPVAVMDRILVRRIEVEEKTAGGLFLADETKEKPAEGIVLSVGPGKYVEGQLQAPTIKAGDHIVFGKFSGAEVKIGLEVLIVLREEDIFIKKVKKVNTQDVVSIQ